MAETLGQMVEKLGQLPRAKATRLVTAVKTGAIIGTLTGTPSRKHYHYDTGGHFD
jgi:hypothetical protein